MSWNPGFFARKRILITGHTGFKGGWLSWWLLRLGAEVSGIALEPDAKSLYSDTGLLDAMDSTIGDIRDDLMVLQTVRRARPEIIIHCAAQSLVLPSYDRPAETFDTNVMGTVHVLEAARLVDSVRAVVIVTSDKCYENDNRSGAYSEEDKMGGFDPYSASKGGAEIVAAAYRRSFFESAGAAGVATVRAGNAIGGGDWSRHRLVADYARAAARNGDLGLRNPHAIRPWQHVLDPLSGYLTVAERLCVSDKKGVRVGVELRPR